MKGCGLVRRLFVVLAVGLMLLGSGLAWWLAHGLALKADSVDLSIEPNTSVRDVALAVQRAGVEVNPQWLYWWFRLSGQARLIKAGNYQIEPGESPYSLLQKLVLGKASMHSFTVIEGWNFAQLQQALQQIQGLQLQTQGLAPEAIMAALGRPGVSPEGRFFPDTYVFAKGSSDLKLLRLAMHTMDKKLETAWQQRLPNSPLRTPEEALILASIVEKETGRDSERAMISGVFANRLRLGMPLQTDPTVIYGLGVAFDGNLRRQDLRTDTPWNTYTRVGLPPTPIAMPGMAALLAAVQPAATPALFFVARGDGSSEFSTTLKAHNQAVAKYQLGR